MENKIKKDARDYILDFLRALKGEPISISELKRRMNKYSYPTILKWVTVLEMENKVSIVDYGSIKLIKCV